MRGSLHVEAGYAELRFERVVIIFVFKMADEAGQTIQRFRIEAQHFADFARCGLAAIRDDIGGHRRAQRAVSLVDVLNGAFALIAAGQIEIDIRPFATFFGKKSFEKQFHLHGIDRRDAQRITNGTVRGRTAALNEDIVVAAELDNIPDDQEIAFEPEFLDQRKLTFNLTAGFLVVWPETFVRAFIRCACGEMTPSFRRRHRIVGELIAKILQRELKPGRKLDGVGDSFRKIVKEPRHFCRCFEMTVGIAGKQPAGGFQRSMIANAREDIENLAFRLCRIADAIRCQ